MEGQGVWCVLSMISCIVSSWTTHVSIWMTIHSRQKNLMGVAVVGLKILSCFSVYCIRTVCLICLISSTVSSCCTHVSIMVTSHCRRNNLGGGGGVELKIIVCIWHTDSVFNLYHFRNNAFLAHEVFMCQFWCLLTKTKYFHENLYCLYYRGYGS